MGGRRRVRPRSGSSTWPVTTTATSTPPPALHPGRDRRRSARYGTIRRSGRSSAPSTTPACSKTRSAGGAPGFATLSASIAPTSTRFRQSTPSAASDSPTKTIQERAWTSPIFYQPEGLGTKGQINYGNGPDSDRLRLKLTIGRVPSELDVNANDLTVTVRDDDVIYTATLPAGAMIEKNPGRTYTYSDPTGSDRRHQEGAAAHQQPRHRHAHARHRQARSLRRAAVRPPRRGAGGERGVRSDRQPVLGALVRETDGAAIASGAQGSLRLVRAIARAPALHFLVLGALLFAVSAPTA